MRQESLRLAAGKAVEHSRPYLVNARGFLAALGRNDAAGSELLSDMGVVEFAIELGVGQHQTDGADSVGGVHQRTQVCAVVRGSGVGLLRQHQLPVEIDCHQPLQPVAPRHGLPVVMVQTAHEKRADRPRAEAGGVDSHLRAAARPGQRDAVHDLVEGAGDGGFVESTEEAIQSRVVRNRSELERTAQFGMFRKPNLSFAAGPVLLAHEAQDGQQLWLRELVLTERRSIAGHIRLADVHGDACELQQTDFSHGKCEFSPNSRRK